GRWAGTGSIWGLVRPERRPGPLSTEMHLRGARGCAPRRVAASYAPPGEWSGLPGAAARRAQGFRMPGFLERLKQRKLVQWAVAYLAGAWVLLQVFGLIGQQFDWPQALLRGITVAA